jgi:adenine-specific DNA-methyltransferase
MSDGLTDLILSLTPEDGSSIGNGAMKKLLRKHVPELSDDDYDAARDALAADGTLLRGSGRGGSIRRAAVADLTLTVQEAPEPAAARAKPRAKPRGKGARKPDEPAQVLSYRHGETRVNNPEVGMVHAATDPDGAKTKWAYDPHLDPVLNFDSARAGIEP